VPKILGVTNTNFSATTLSPAFPAVLSRKTRQPPLSGLSFLVDTGAAVSVIPHSASHGTAQGPNLAGADGKGITSWGKVYRSVGFGGKTFTDVPFVLAAVAKPILGADFFTKHHLLVDSATNSVLYAETLLPIGGSTDSGSGENSGSAKKSKLVAHLSAIPLWFETF
jgi:hypothetical protein